MQSGGRSQFDFHLVGFVHLFYGIDVLSPRGSLLDLYERKWEGEIPASNDYKEG